MKKDGTVLEINITFKRDLVSNNIMHVEVNNAYCDKDIKTFANTQALLIAKTISDSAKEINYD